MVSNPRESLQLFEFDPPFTDANIETVRNIVLQSIPSHEVLKRQYFESCYESLLDYALHYKNEKKNFSLSIGHFIPNFDPRHAHEHVVWDEDNIWIKVRVQGGAGDAFRSRFMATHLGLAKIDWKRKTFRSIKEVGAAVTINLAAKSVGLDSVGESASEKVEGRLMGVWKKAKKREHLRE